MRIGIVGLGLMGGSWALALKKVDKELQVIGFDNDAAHRKEALECGLVDRCVDSLDDLIQSVEQVVLAIPVDAVEEVLPVVLDLINSTQTVIDFGSTKSMIADRVKQHPKRNQYIAAHPIAGTEYSGPQAAFSALYSDKIMIICDDSLTEKERLSHWITQCEKIGMKVVFQTAKAHDLHLAYVSHLSHVTSFSLSNAVLKKEKEENQILNLAGSGFESTVRLAKSSPEMWSPIFLKNREAMLEAVEAYLKEVNRFKEYLHAEDAASIHQFLTDGRLIRKILK